MGTDKNIYSRRILAIVGFIYLLNFITENSLARLFELNVPAVLTEYQFWRLFTFPLAPGSIEAILLMAYTFIIIAPRFENLLKPGLILVLLVPMISLHGIIHTLVFWNTKVGLAGFESMSLFFITIYSLTAPKQKIKLPFLPVQKLIWISSVIVILWAGIKYTSSIQSSLILYQTISSASFGILSAIVSYAQIMILSRILRPKRTVRTESAPVVDETRKLAVIKEAKFDPFAFTAEDDYLDDDLDFVPDEQKLNRILDKILDYGQESLSGEEKRYLEKYSKKI
jgi:hypothetical protein